MFGVGGKLSRSPSVTSIVSTHDNVDIPPPEDIYYGEEYTDDNDYQFTSEHPLGSILLKIVQDQTNLTRKSKTGGMATNIKELCSNFHNAIKLERANVNNKLSSTVAGVERSLMDKELNSHSVNAAVEIPKNFSTTPVITSSQKLAEIMKIFPKSGKFSGNSQKDGHYSVVEFLNTLTRAQNQCLLTEDEFIDRILDTTTGTAHELVFEWKLNGDSVNSIYHNLVVNFDHRLPAEEARTRLHNFVIGRNSSLAKAQSAIQLLIARACTLLPPGDSRIAYKNMEGCTTLIRALPPNSSQLANNTYQNFTTRLGRACTLEELFRGLNQYRSTIDKDIKQNGASSNPTNYKNNKRPAGKSSGYSSFNMSIEGKKGYQNNRPMNNKPRTSPNETSYTPRPQIIRPNMNRKIQFNKGSNNKPPNKNFAGRRFQQNILNKSCSLCGMSNHKTTECKNMRDDSGKILEMLPTYGVCSKCPEKVKPRLHHPEVSCPYRLGGPFNKHIKNAQNWNKN